ncbi:DUF3891 domain-containing protein [Pleurocapsa sp. CCALA 161]|uniref:DUF3891 family protein n=1 Tax=Pleurocapsa sp. CCALA 161 TaxID=2107688 RepID=UPI000D078157|nr:DUF3891 family protein [Pleurocapsa sp. CCALA 161]PSB09720.1 DUF3891 domain-containing protein [Pleurocapsa sp. CCALA 161]
MIVNMKADGWEIIYHRAHALLAAQIAAHWNQADSPLRITDTIAAISHHDDLEKEWEEDMLSEAGAPKDFTLEGQTSVEKLNKHIDEALYRGRWVALLTSMHTCFLNQGSDSEDIAQFVKEQERLQKLWRKELGVTQKEANSDYQFMKWCDRLSLILCQQQIPDNNRKLEINDGPDGQKYYIAKSDENSLTVTPWCFTEYKVKFYVETSHLSQVEFKDNTEIIEALKNAPRKYQEWIFEKK